MMMAFNLIRMGQVKGQRVLKMAFELIRMGQVKGHWCQRCSEDESIVKIFFLSYGDRR